jgi:hypothetical protein
LILIIEKWLLQTIIGEIWIFILIYQNIKIIITVDASSVLPSSIPKNSFGVCERLFNHCGFYSHQVRAKERSPYQGEISWAKEENLFGTNNIPHISRVCSFNHNEITICHSSLLASQMDYSKKSSMGI